MMAMTLWVVRVVGAVSDGVECGGLLLLFGSLVSGLEVKVTVVVKVVEGRVIVWVRVRRPDLVVGREGKAAREDVGMALFEEVVDEEDG